MEWKSPPLGAAGGTIVDFVHLLKRHLLATIVYYVPRHYSRHWVLSSKQQRELAQTYNLCFLDSISGSQIFLLEIFCNISSVSNIVLAFNLQSDYVKDFRQNIPLLKTMKKSQMKSKEFHPFLMPGGQWDWFSFLSQLIGLTSYFVVKTTLWISGEEKWAKSKALPVPLPCMSKIIILCLTESDYLSWHTGSEEKPIISCANTVIALFLFVTRGFSTVVIP